MAGAEFEDNPNFNKGKGATLAGMLGIAAIAIAAFAWYLVSGQPNPYGELGKQVNGLRGKHFDQFLNCALPNARLAKIANDRDLRDEFHNRAQTGGARYATHLRQKCGPELDELSPKLRALLPPDDAATGIEAMAKASEELRRAVGDYSDYVAAQEGDYAAEKADKAVEPVARAWYEFRKAHAELNKIVRKGLGRE